MLIKVLRYIFAMIVFIVAMFCMTIRTSSVTKIKDFEQTTENLDATHETQSNRPSFKIGGYFVTNIFWA